jgi:hypothetical protein
VLVRVFLLVFRWMLAVVVDEPQSIPLARVVYKPAHDVPLGPSKRIPHHLPFTNGRLVSHTSPQMYQPRQ